MKKRTRRQFLGDASRLAAAASLGGLAGCERRGPEEVAARRPNLLFFLPDQHRPDWLGWGQGLPIETPSLERLAHTGVQFRQTVCASPVCAPSRACLAAGKEYDRCGVRSNRDRFPLEQTTYYRLLRDAGYHVMGCGKLDLAKPDLDWGIDGKRSEAEWGFSDLVDNSGKGDGMFAYLSEPEGAKDPYYAYLDSRNPPMGRPCAEDFRRRRSNFPDSWWGDTEPSPLDDDGYCDNYVARKGLELLERAPADRPWHLVVNFVGPHPPVDITRSMERRVRGPERVLAGLPQPHHYTGAFTAADHERTRQNYAAMIENIDGWLGRYLDRLEERGELDDTIVVYSSDHGEMLGDHGRWGKSIPYQASLGVPLLVGGPGVRAGTTSDALVSLMDLAATFLDYASVPVPSDMDSRSLRPLLEGRTDRHRAHLLSGLLTREGDWRLAYDGRYKLVRGFGDEELRLWDLDADPEETTNLAAAQPDQVRRLEELLPRPA